MNSNIRHTKESNQRSAEGGVTRGPSHSCVAPARAWANDFLCSDKTASTTPHCPHTTVCRQEREGALLFEGGPPPRLPLQPQRPPAQGLLAKQPAQLPSGKWAVALAGLTGRILLQKKNCFNGLKGSFSTPAPPSMPRSRQLHDGAQRTPD